MLRRPTRPIDSSGRLVGRLSRGPDPRTSLARRPAPNGQRAPFRPPAGPKGFFVGQTQPAPATTQCSRQGRHRERHDEAGAIARRRGLPGPSRHRSGSGADHDRRRHAGPRGHRRAGARTLPRGHRLRHRLRHPRRARSCRPTTPCSTRRRCATSSCATSRAPATLPRATRSATGKVGVCMATSGPGATNLVTPLADAHMDSVPIVAITGQVASAAIGTRRLPGGRHPRHHDADHQAQLPRDRRGQDPAGHRRGLPRRQHRPPRPRPRRHQQGRPAGHDDVQLAAPDRPARLPAGPASARQADPRGLPAHRRGQAARSSTSAAASCGPARARRCAASSS